MFSRATSLPAVCECLIKAAYDPRVAGLFIKVGLLSCGWAKVEEIRRHIDFFRQSGKFTIGYMERGNEKEYFLLSACEEVYLPPSGSLGLRGLSVSATFLRGTLNKIGIEPQVRRIGKYKSAGDQLLREDMSEPQREQLTALLEDLYSGFVAGVAKSRSKAENEVIDMLEEGFVDTESFREGGWVTDLKYMDELIDMVKERQKVDKKKKLKRVTLRRYASVSPSAFGLGAGKVIAVIRASGSITGAQMAQAGSITTKQTIREIQQARDNKAVKAIVLRVDSPGGDALASDIMWRELQKAAVEKPVIASMSDVAASGGYYLAMAASKIVAEGLTITGSIGVVLGKFSLQELYKKIGVGKEMLSKGRYAEILAESRSFSKEEEEYFTRLAEHSYTEFRNKAAECRGMATEEMQELAQGRVWSGRRAADVGLIDAVGGISRAIAVAKQAADIAPDKPVRLMELSRQKGSPLEALQGAGAMAGTLTWVLFLLFGLGSLIKSRGQEGKADFVIDAALAAVGLAGPLLQSKQSDVEYLMEDVSLDDGPAKDVAPQAVLDESLMAASGNLPPLLRDLISKLL
ncbi:unnamed protein product [Ostreobium quekettii]|uniref:Peptidase S49 domain-containing protein n=1 Tax=Ostreobium quekettii TaxID=121088 RepID=A0A8S1IQX4_9CHLO|nr:unnamed protein product [Ostreobium quekettii]